MTFKGGYYNNSVTAVCREIRSHNNGTPIKVGGDSHERWLKILFLSLNVQKLLN